MRRLALAALLVGVAGCPDNPFKASTWTKKLNDPRESERAVTKLEELCDPSAIDALGQAWEDQGKPSRLLQVIISLSRPLTADTTDASGSNVPGTASTNFCTDYATTGRPASWDKAVPYLAKALSEVDDANPRSVESAQKAADALGDAHIDGGLDPLIELASKPVTKKLITAQISALRAIGKYDGEKAKAAAALMKVLDRDLPPNPRTVDKDHYRAAEEVYTLAVGMAGQAVNSLADLRVPGAVKSLKLAMYRTPELFTQIRRALVACGPDAETALRKILRREDPDVDAFFKEKRLDKFCDASGGNCQDVSARDFYPAVVLGDFYDPASVPDLLMALDRPVAPQYYNAPNDPSQATQYNAVFDSLRKIGAASAADRVRSVWMMSNGPTPAKSGAKGAPPPAATSGLGTTDPDMILNIRMLAVGAYPFVAHDDTGVNELGTIAFDNSQDIQLRTESATAFARLSRDPKHIQELNDLAGQYYKQEADYRAKADAKPKQDADAADKELEAARKARDDAKANSLRAANDKSKSTDDIRAAADNAKKADDAYKEVVNKHKAAVKPYRDLDGKAKNLHFTGRMFQAHIARIEVAIRCGDKIDCYVATLKETPADAQKNVAQYIQGVNGWTKDEALNLQEGEVERAMLELGKMGPKAQSETATLLEAAKSEDRLIRQSVLLALPKVAKVPCDNCEAKLDEAIKAGEGKSTLGDLNLETTMLRNYFAYAGGRVPSKSASDAPTVPVEQAPAKKK